MNIKKAITVFVFFLIPCAWRIRSFPQIQLILRSYGEKNTGSTRQEKIPFASVVNYSWLSLSRELYQAPNPV